MTDLTVIPAALIAALSITLLFSFLFNRRLNGLWIFFLLIFLVTWTGQLWIRPFGPVAWGIAWAPLLLVALFFSFLFIALVPTVRRSAKGKDEVAEEPMVAVSIFFWIIVILLLISLALGYYRPANGPVLA